MHNNGRLSKILSDFFTKKISFKSHNPIFFSDCALFAGKEADDEDEGDNDDNDNDDDDADDSDTDTESDNKAICNELNEEIVELTSEISLKQKLIEELEMSQKRMASMKQQYEKKLLELNNRILQTQAKLSSRFFGSILYGNVDLRLK